MNRFAYLSILLAACTGGDRANSGQCPAGEVCSPATPRGLHFIGDPTSDAILNSLTAPAATAIGGTQEIALQYDRGDGVLIALALPFAADADAADGVKVDSTSGSVVTVRGVGSRQNYLRIVDPTTADLYDRKMLAGAALDTIALIATDFENIPVGSPLAFATGNEKIGVALFGKVQEGSSSVTERIVDHSMVISGAGGTQTAWDEIHIANATTGMSTLAITAGDKPTANLDLVVVDHADAVAPLTTNPAGIPAAGGGQFCFEASSGTRFVVGLTWTYTIDGAAVTTTELQRNCVSVSTTKSSGSVAVVARAGGQMASLSVAIGPSAVRFAPFGNIGRGTSAGDRASM